MAMTEQEMRDFKVPTFDTIDELTEFVRGLVDQPHDYGTCVHAMSMAAVAAMNYVAKQLNVSGFQHSCADMDILRRNRGLEWGCVQNFENLLYPQFADRYPGWDQLLIQHRDTLAERARKLLEGDLSLVHPRVLAHWQKLAAAPGLVH